MSGAYLPGDTRQRIQDLIKDSSITHISSRLQSTLMYQRHKCQQNEAKGKYVDIILMGIFGGKRCR